MSVIFFSESRAFCSVCNHRVYPTAQSSGRFLLFNDDKDAVSFRFANRFNIRHAPPIDVGRGRASIFAIPNGIDGAQRKSSYIATPFFLTLLPTKEREGPSAFLFPFSSSLSPPPFFSDGKGREGSCGGELFFSSPPFLLERAYNGGPNQEEEE